MAPQVGFLTKKVGFYNRICSVLVTRIEKFWPSNLSWAEMHAVGESDHLITPSRPDQLHLTSDEPEHVMLSQTNTDSDSG